MAIKGNIQEADRLFGEVEDKDEEYYFLKMQLVQSLYSSSLPNNEAINRANNLLEEISKNQGTGILAEAIKKSRKAIRIG